jgi:hypothetical protein
MSIQRAFPVVSLLVLVACGGGTPPAENPPPEGTGDAVTDPAPTAEEKTEEKSEEAPKEEAKKEIAPKLDKPKSESTIAGTSISEIDGAALQEAVKKLGWAKEGQAVGSLVVGSYEALNYEIEKGKLKAKIEIARPAASPGEVSGTTMTPPAEQKASKEKDGSAVFYDEASDVLVVVTMTEGKPADAKGILGKLVKKVVSKKKPEAKAPPADAKAAPADAKAAPADAKK